MVRAADDGYDHELAPGLRASEDARRLAEELAFAHARIEQLKADPSGVYAEVAAIEDPKEAAWVTFLIATLSPLENDDPFASIVAARTTFASGELPDVSDLKRGPRASSNPAGALKGFRTWLERPDALAAEASLPAGRRFDRLFERLGLPGTARAQRYEFLVLCGALGVADVEAQALRIGEATDPTTIAAKRVFAIGDPTLIAARAAALVEAAGVPIAALDLALVNWALAPGVPRITGGIEVGGYDDATERIARVLGVGTEVEQPDEDDDEAEVDEVEADEVAEVEAVEVEADEADVEVAEIEVAEVETEVAADAADEPEIADEDVLTDTEDEADAEAGAVLELELDQQ